MCAFMIIGGLVLFEPSNMVPFAPMGASGVIKGSSVAFFGYLGYDEVRLVLSRHISKQDTHDA